MKPRPVWLDIYGWSKPDPPVPGLLLEWRQVADKRGVRQWQGLVIWARGGGDLPWSVAMGWMSSANLKPMDGDDVGDRA